VTIRELWVVCCVQRTRQYLLLVHNVHQQAGCSSCQHPVAVKYNACHRCFDQIAANLHVWSVTVSNNFLEHLLHAVALWLHDLTRVSHKMPWYLLLLAFWNIAAVLCLCVALTVIEKLFLAFWWDNSCWVYCNLLEVLSACSGLWNMFYYLILVICISC